MDTLKELKAYRGRRVLVTGHTGFKGSWLTLWLKALGAEVCGVSLAPNTRPSLFLAARVSKGIRDERKDIRNAVAMQKIFRSFKPEAVFHLAAQPLVSLSYEEPFETFETNVLGTLNILEAAKNSRSVRALVCVTSDKCYRNTGSLAGYREDSALGGHDPYSASKAAAEIVFAGYSESFFRPSRTLAAASVRAGNVIGGGDWARDRIVADAARCLAARKSIFVRNPKAVRPWQHVAEPLAGYLMLGSKLLKKQKDFEGSWNFGPSPKNPKSVQALVEEFIACWGRGKWHREASRKTGPEARTLVLDSRKAWKELGWKQVWSFEETVERTALWYRNFYKGVDARRLCIEDIHAYLRRAGSWR